MSKKYKPLILFRITDTEEKENYDTFNIEISIRAYNILEHAMGDQFFAKKFWKDGLRWHSEEEKKECFELLKQMISTHYKMTKEELEALEMLKVDLPKL